MRERIRKLREQLLDSEDTICTERAHLVTEAYEKNVDNPYIIQRALALEHILNKMTIYIRDNELLVGNLSSALGARPLYPEYHLGVEEIHATGSIGEKVSPNNNPELIDIHTFWKEKDLFHFIEKEREADIRLLQKELIINTAAEINGHGHITVDYEKILKVGLTRIKNEVIEKLDNEKSEKRRIFYQSLVIALDAVIQFSIRYSKLSLDLSKKEKDGKRREDLKNISETTKNVPAQPPSNFYEALQFIWFIYLVLHQESNGYSISLGRLDKILYPYYKTDLKDGRITKDDALELIENFNIKIMEIPIGGLKDTKTASITLGGIGKDDKYECNDISYLFLEAIRDLRLNQPPVTIRWHKNAPERFKIKAMEMLKYGTGYPGLFGDKSAISALKEQHNVSEEDAYDWCVVGCAELYVAGKISPVDAGLVNLPVVLELAVNDGISILSNRRVGCRTKKPDKYKSIEELIAQYEIEFNYLLEKLIKIDKTIKNLHKTYRPMPLTSALMTNCIKEGKDLLNGGEKYNFICVGLFSMANLIDSIAAIDELVFKRKMIKLSSFVKSLSNDFKDNADLKSEIERIPKYGNNEDVPDRFIDIVSKIHHQARSRIYEKEKIDIAYESIPREVHVKLGKISPATFDGRIKGQAFADGIGPGQGRDKNGLTSVINSVLKIKPKKYITNGYVFNLKLHPRMFENADSFSKIIALVDIFFDQGGEQMQVTCLKPEDLIKAQKYPEKYKDLIVRVAGFSAYFVTLRKELQDEIISRTVYEDNLNII